MFLCNFLCILIFVISCSTSATAKSSSKITVKLRKNCIYFGNLSWVACEKIFCQNAFLTCNFLLFGFYPTIKGYYPSPLICCGHGISTVNKKAADIFKVGGLFSSFIHHVFSINSSVGVHSKFSGNRVDYLNVLKPPSSTRNRLFFLGNYTFL